MRFEDEPNRSPIATDHDGEAVFVRRELESGDAAAWVDVYEAMRHLVVTLVEADVRSPR
jgi:hypothetical protein